MENGTSEKNKSICLEDYWLVSSWAETIGSIGGAVNMQHHCVFPALGVCNETSSPTDFYAFAFWLESHDALSGRDIL